MTEVRVKLSGPRELGSDQLRTVELFDMTGVPLGSQTFPVDYLDLVREAKDDDAWAQVNITLRPEAYVGDVFHAVDMFARLLLAIETYDQDYDVRYGLVLRALSMARELGYPAGIAIDPKEPGWPVVYIELPDHGQISWHMPAHETPYDGHSTEEKYLRTRAYAKDRAGIQR